MAKHIEYLIASSFTMITLRRYCLLKATTIQLCGNSVTVKGNQAHSTTKTVRQTAILMQGLNEYLNELQKVRTAEHLMPNA
jgi:hypothetical protein